MPADLDDLFAQLGEHADAVPLGTAATARRRGTQRTRIRSMLAAALAVCLAGGGAAWLIRPEQRAPSPPATTKGTGKLPEVGSLLPYGGTPRFAMAAISGGRVFSGWQDESGAIKVSAADVRTGAQLWPARSPGRFDDFGGVFAFDRAVLVSVEHNDGTDPDRTLYVYDPATGKQRWSLPYGVDDDLIFENDVLIHMVTETGLTRALDWTTGEPRWSLPAGPDRPTHSLGLYLQSDEDRAGSGLPLDFQHDNFVQVAKSGKAQTRSVRTGKVQATVAMTASAGDSAQVAYDLWLYSVEQPTDDVPYRVWATRLDPAGTSTIVFSGPEGRTFGGLAPCGPQRICVLDRGANDGTATLTAVDAEQRRALWRIEAPESADTVQSLHGRTLVSGDGNAALYDPDGKQVYLGGPSTIGWLGPENLFTAPQGEPGKAARISAADGRATPLGEVPALSRFCAWTTERLACPTETGLRLWSLSG